MYRSRFAGQSYNMFLAENGEHGPIGFADVGRARQGDWQCDAELYAIYVLKAFQRKGVGRRLFDLAVAAALARGMKSLCVIVLRDSPYRGFYEKLGGRQIFESAACSGDVEQAHVVYAWAHLHVDMCADLSSTA
jgi:GNAT superfamily N-acetyltransferase